MFARWMNQYQKTDLSLQGTTIQRKQDEIKDQLLNFIASEISPEVLGKEEILSQLKTHSLKFIKY